jgi:hypothetical protein
MPWKGEKYLWTVADKLGDLLQSDYGTERDEKEADLLDLVDAARRDQVARLRPMLDSLGTGQVTLTFLDVQAFGEKLLNELDPDKPDTV